MRCSRTHCTWRARLHSATQMVLPAGSRPPTHVNRVCRIRHHADLCRPLGDLASHLAISYQHAAPADMVARYTHNKTTRAETKSPNHASPARRTTQQRSRHRSHSRDIIRQTTCTCNCTVHAVSPDADMTGVAPIAYTRASCETRRLYAVNSLQDS